MRILIEHITSLKTSCNPVHAVVCLTDVPLIHPIVPCKPSLYFGRNTMRLTVPRHPTGNKSMRRGSILIIFAVFNSAYK